MPEGTKVARCVDKVMAKGHSKESAIKICQASTGQSYETGKKPKESKYKKAYADTQRRM